ncbi:hypothetical protein FHU33_1976 [Blastococcus colisei]|uniref:Uncharacterized protein n=1 Tax=Blastococcus colisei TaxID=1564162 RepID=A0A543PEQ4_9ACTN|nr:hypothetical protein [Blastococcus colisei]TQN42572.1 hypothetical protein FHU33_1976 [Blastococcus colisei]
MKHRDPNELRWLATLAGGGVAVLAVAGLLETLRRSVVNVDEAVDRVWTAGKLVAQNTQAGHLLRQTTARAATLRDHLESANGAKERAR